MADVMDRLIGLRKLEFSAVQALKVATLPTERQDVYDRVRLATGMDFLAAWRQDEPDAIAALELAREVPRG